MLLKKLAPCLQTFECIFKSVKFFEHLSLDEVRLDLDVQLGHELVLGFLWAHILESLWLLLDLRKGLDGLLRGRARFIGCLNCFIQPFDILESDGGVEVSLSGHAAQWVPIHLLLLFCHADSLFKVDQTLLVEPLGVLKLSLPVVDSVQKLRVAAVHLGLEQPGTVI